jgi:lysosomal Pro-X carboxypeptidase
MYCGNEGPIEMFYKNTGWYNDYVTKELKGLLVYPEHRYFGQSWPFGDQKTSMTKENIVYLTTEEAMMDFVEFIIFLKKTYCADCPVVVFGGSYGGMLATWMRMKYPNVVDMAHAASAPIYYYRNRKNFDLGTFYKIVTKDYAIHNKNCPNVIRESFKRLIAYFQSSKAPIADLSKWFNLCTPIKKYTDISLLMDYINTGYSYMAMINYPYPTSFLKNVTAWPANSSCIPLDSVTTSSSDE